MFGPPKEGHCGFCAEKLPHRKLTCPDCLLGYDDCEDWSGPAHSDHDCIRELVKQRDQFLVLMAWGEWIDGMCLRCARPQQLGLHSVTCPAAIACNWKRART